MSKQEFILLIPAIVYGVAIVDLLKAFRLKIYWEISFWGIYMMMNAIILWLSLFNQLNAIVNNNLNLVLVIAQAILFAKSAELITPEEKDTDTRTYYEGVIKYVILLQVLVFVIAGINEILIYDDRQNMYVRPVGIILGLVAVFWPNKYYRWGFMALVGFFASSILLGVIR